MQSDRTQLIKQSPPKWQVVDVLLQILNLAGLGGCSFQTLFIIYQIVQSFELVSFELQITFLSFLLHFIKG